MTLASLCEFLALAEPEIVVWLYFEGNDLVELEEESKVDILNQYLTTGQPVQNLVQRQREVDSLIAEYHDRKW